MMTRRKNENCTFSDNTYPEFATYMDNAPLAKSVGCLRTRRDTLHDLAPPKYEKPFHFYESIADEVGYYDNVPLTQDDHKPLQRFARRINPVISRQTPSTATTTSRRRFGLRRQPEPPEPPPRPKLPKLTNDRSKIPTDNANRITPRVRFRKWWSALLRRAAVAIYKRAVHADPS